MKRHHAGRLLFPVVLMLGMAAAPVRCLAADILIGVAAPLSGADAVFGTQLVQGVGAAVSEINSGGGLLGQKLKMVARDDKSDPKTAVAIAKTFVADRASLVVGNLFSATTVPASSVYAASKIIEIAPAAIAPIVTDRGIGTLFRIGGREDGQVAAAVRFLAARQAKVAIVNDRTSTGKAIADAVRKGLGDDGIRDSFYGSFEKGTRDLAPLVSRLKASGATMVFFGGSPGDAGALARQMRESGVHASLMGGLAMASDEFAAAAGPAADGALVVFARDPHTMAGTSDVVRRLGSKAQPDALVFNSYAAMQVYRQAATIAGTLDADAVAAVLHSGREFSTVLGAISFDAKGDMMPGPWTVYVWHRGATGRMSFDDLARS